MLIRGGTYEDFEIGQTFESDGRTITDADIVNFAGVSGDFNPIHLDRVQSGSGPFERPVAHGLLGISIATGLLDSMGLFRGSMIAMLGIDDWRFRRPMFVGDTVHLHLTIADRRCTSDGRRGILRRELRLLNQDDEVLQEGAITVMVRCREPEGDPSS